MVDRTTKYALMAEILSEKDTDMELIQKLLQLFKKIKTSPEKSMVPTNALATVMNQYSEFAVLPLNWQEISVL